MEQLGWLLSLFLAGFSFWLWRRGQPEMGDAAVATPGSRPGSAAADDPRDGALQAVGGYLKRTVTPDLQALRAGLPEGSSAHALVDQALQAVEDLAFYASPPPDEPWTEEVLAQVVQEAVREYTLQSHVPVRVHPPATPLRVRVRRDAFKDAVFMLLINAGLYGGGKPIDVHLEGRPPRGFGIRIRDSGPGFTPEGLSRAVEPFWSTDPRGLGLGLPYVRRRVALFKGELTLRNRPEGGAEVVIAFPDGVVAAPSP
jgi:signal transduction histidine kinase